MRKIIKRVLWVTLQVHEDSSNSLPSPFNVEFIYEIVMVRLIFLPYFVMENLKSFSIFCNYYFTLTPQGINSKKIKSNNAARELKREKSHIHTQQE